MQPNWNFPIQWSAIPNFWSLSGLLNYIKREKTKTCVIGAAGLHRISHILMRQRGHKEQCATYQCWSKQALFKSKYFRGFVSLKFQFYVVIPLSSLLVEHYLVGKVLLLTFLTQIYLSNTGA